MKKIQQIALLVLVVFGLVVSGTNAFAASAKGDASANVVVAITINSTQALSMGSGLETEVLTVLPDGSTTDNGSSLASQGTITPAIFNVGGEDGRTYNTTIPTSASFTTTPTGALAMSITLDCTDAGAVSVADVDEIRCGGSLTIPALQVAGDYSGTFEVSVNY